MPLFLWLYLVGLALALLTGAVFYYAIGGHVAPLLKSLFGPRPAYLWGRSFRLMLVASAIVGGLSVRWYGCGGYEDYADVAASPRLMVEKTAEQTAEAIRFTTRFVLVAAFLGAVAFAVLNGPWTKHDRTELELPPTGKPPREPPGDPPRSRP